MRKQPQISPLKVRRRSDYAYEPPSETQIEDTARDLRLATAVMTQALEKLAPLTEAELLEIIAKDTTPGVLQLTGRHTRDTARQARAREAAAIQARSRPPRGTKAPVKQNVDVGTIGAYRGPQPSFGKEE